MGRFCQFSANVGSLNKAVLIPDRGDCSPKEGTIQVCINTTAVTATMPRKSNLDYPVGRNWIPVNFQVGNVENGIVTSVKVALNAMSSINPDLIREGVSPLGALQDYIGQLAQSGLDIETINVLMRQAYDRGDALPFFACVMPETPNERKFMIEEFRKLQEALPLLTVICLDKKKEAKDYEYLAGFNVILP